MDKEHLQRSTELTAGGQSLVHTHGSLCRHRTSTTYITHSWRTVLSPPNLAAYADTEHLQHTTELTDSGQSTTPGNLRGHRTSTIYHRTQSWWTVHSPPHLAACVDTEHLQHTTELNTLNLDLKKHTHDFVCIIFCQLSKVEINETQQQQQNNQRTVHTSMIESNC